MINVVFDSFKKFLQFLFVPARQKFYSEDRHIISMNVYFVTDLHDQVRDHVSAVSLSGICKTRNTTFFWGEGGAALINKCNNSHILLNNSILLTLVEIFGVFAVLNKRCAPFSKVNMFVPSEIYHCPLHF